MSQDNPNLDEARKVLLGHQGGYDAYGFCDEVLDRISQAAAANAARILQQLFSPRNPPPGILSLQ